MPRTRCPSVHCTNNSFSAPCALQLQRHARRGLEAGGEQQRRHDAFAEQGAHGRRIVVRRDDVAPSLARGARARRECRCPRARRSALRSWQRRACLRSASLTCCGFALPRDAFMIWPTRKPSTCCLPARNCSTCVGFAAMTSADELVDGARVGDLREPALLDDLVDGAFARPDGLEDFLRDLAGDRAGRDLVEQRRECRSATRGSRLLPSDVAIQRARELAHDPVRRRSSASLSSPSRRPRSSRRARRSTRQHLAS